LACELHFARHPSERHDRLTDPRQNQNTIRLEDLDMRITPFDIRKHEFRKAMRGLDAEEVYAFLSTVGDEYEAVLNDNKALRERLLELDDKVQEYRTMEKTLRDTLLTAERVTVEAKDNARREANIIIKEAQIEADRSLRDIKSEAMKLHQEVSQLRNQRESYLGRMKVIAESLLRFIESVEDDFYEEDDAYSDQLPTGDGLQAAAEVIPPAPAENNDLFKRARTEGSTGPDSEVEPAEQQGGPATMPVGAKKADPSGDRHYQTPGIPSDLRTGEGVERPVPSTVPRRGAEEAPAPAGDEARSQSGANSTVADIGSIIERMADGHKDISGGQSTQAQYQPATGPATEPRQFDPVSAAPSGPIATGDAGDEPPQTLEATTEDPTQARGPEPRTPAGNPWKRAQETATAVETLDAETEPGQTMDTDVKVTSEMSLEQIRRDIERRIAEEKNNT
jgi:cell division initiation protein